MYSRFGSDFEELTLLGRGGFGVRVQHSFGVYDVQLKLGRLKRYGVRAQLWFGEVSEYAWDVRLGSTTWVPPNGSSTSRCTGGNVSATRLTPGIAVDHRGGLRRG